MVLRLEVEVVDVVGLEDEGLDEQDGCAGVDGVTAETSGGECLTRRALDLALNEQGGSVVREVAEVLDVPESALFARAVFDKSTHLVRCPKPGQRHLTYLVLVLEYLGRC